VAQERLPIWIPDVHLNGVKVSQVLYPFVGSQVDHDGYDVLASRGQEVFERTTLEQARFAVLPFDGNVLVDSNLPAGPSALAAARKVVGRAAQRGLKTIIVANTDRVEPIPLPQKSIIVLRPSILRSKKRANEYALPAWHNELFSKHCNSELKIQPWRQIPSVGFCGHAARGRPPLTRRIKLLLQDCGVPIPHNDGIWLRSACMDYLARSGEVETNFIVRDHYFGASFQNDLEKQACRDEYIRNILDNDYSLCVRGFGNHSFRVYESLSLGRPVLLLDTDCVLPLEELINYEEVMVRVPDRELPNVAYRLKAFHDSLNEVSFERVQRRARDVWEESLSPLGYYRSLARILAKFQSSPPGT